MRIRTRKTQIYRLAVIVFCFTFTVWLWRPSKDKTSQAGLRQGSFFSSNRLLSSSQEQDYDHSQHVNKTLEILRKNMTLSRVNMTGIGEIIRQANRSVVDSRAQHNIMDHLSVPNPHPFRYLLNPKGLCKKSNVFLLVYVHTAPSHIKRRTVIRDTWGNAKYYPTVQIRLIFVMGRERNSSMQDAVQLENSQYHDIMQEDFIDTYKNLTYKGIAALKWISTYCADASFILKTDDDIFVNMFTLLRHLESIQKTGNGDRGMLLCLVWSRMKVMREGKWKVAKEEWAEDFYPTYCSGSAFVMSTDVAVRLHEVSYHVPFFWVDDFYITGLLPMKAGNITHVQFMSTYVLHGKKFLQEKFTGPQWFTYIYSHINDLNLVQSVWSDLVKLANGEVVQKVPFVLPGSLPDDKELIKKEKDEELRQLEEAKKKSAEQKNKEKKQ